MQEIKQGEPGTEEEVRRSAEIPQESVQMSPEQQQQMQYLYNLRDKYLKDFTVIGQHVVSHFTSTFDDLGKKIFKNKAAYTGMFPQLVLKKIWKSDNKYNANGTLKDAKAEAKRLKFLEGVA